LESDVKKIIGSVFNQMADALETGTFGRKIRVGLTTLGSEHGVDELVRGAELAAHEDPMIDVVLVGSGGSSNLETVEAQNEDVMYKEMEKLLDAGELDCCVTLHYSFPIGVSTVGKVITPGIGRPMYLATTTGTTAVDRVEAMIRNAIYGIATAKADGIPNPTVGILNVDGARQVERALVQMRDNGYNINFTQSLRKDGGYVMRGNDLLAGTPDVMVTDTLTGNLLMKIFSAYTTGGNYEATGYGYGPGVGEDYSRIILILSRASGAPVVANAIKYGADLVRGGLVRMATEEIKASKIAGMDQIISGLKKDKQSTDSRAEVAQPPKKVVTSAISWIDIMDLDNAVEVLWRNKLYAETGMGCTGPVVMVSEEDLEAAQKLLEQHGYAAKAEQC
jgi:glycosyltransferase involved in cell wall biosynthesis